MIRFLVSLFLILLTVSARADILWNGFASFYGRESLSEDVYENGLDNDTVDFSNNMRAGLNLRANITDDLDFVAQLVMARRLSNEPDWYPAFDWVFADYNLNKNINFKIGRQLYPSSVTAEYFDVGVTYPWRVLPLPYSVLASFKSFEGVSASYQVPFDSMTATVKVYGGNSIPTKMSRGANIVQLEVENILGILFSVEGDGWKFQTAYSGFTLSSTVTAPLFTAESQYPRNKNIEIGGKYDKHNIVVYMEYGNNEVGDSSDRDYLMGYYGTFGYRFGKWLPHYSYSKGQRVVTGALYGRDEAHTVGLNYQVDPSIVIKTDYTQNMTPNGSDLVIGGAGTTKSISLGVDIVF